MPEPKEHFKDRGWIETILRYIPGFRGYLEKEYRRESDALQRQWLADRLQRSKAGIDSVSRQLVDKAQLDALPQCDRLRGRIDKLIGKISGAMNGYSGFFDLVQVTEETLDRVYEHDMAIMQDVEAFSEAVENLPQQTDEAAIVNELAQLMAQVDQVEVRFDDRAEILAGLA
ncbi:MAG: hypothetical protein MPJ50_09965 [Pirellulales bacterium]|nr:hypothetical protein [Pirellulales bacterium]